MNGKTRCAVRRIQTLMAITLMQILPLFSVAAASAEQLFIGLDWSDFPKEHDRALSLQDAGKLPIPVVFLNGSPVGLVDDIVNIPTDATPNALVEVGIAGLLERPLYKWTLENTKMDVPGWEVTASDFSIHEDSRPGEISALLTSVSAFQSRAVRNESNRLIVYLNPAPYLAFVRAAASTMTESFWNERTIVRVFQTDSKSGEIFPPVFEKYGGPDGVFAAIKSNSLSEPYARAIDTGWIERSSELSLVIGDPEQLLLRSEPVSAQIIVDGIVQKNKWTEYKMPIARNLWPYVDLQADGYETCKVDVAAVVAPTTSTDPYSFECTLKPK